MGQYYNPAVLDEQGKPQAWLYSHDYDNGLKLMEHSYIGNNFVQAVERLLIPSGEWYQQPIIWAGDYADDIEGETDENGESVNVYFLCHDTMKLNPKPLTNAEADEYRFIVNYDKQQFVDKQNALTGWGDYRIHPLPLLTADGNGRGGGDYRGDSDLVGFWAGDRIGLEKSAPEGFDEVIPDFIED